MQRPRLIILTVIFFCMCLAQVSAQGNETEPASHGFGSIVYLGVASGVDNFTGIIGPSLETNVSGKFAIYGGAGIGSWGTKISGGIKYYSRLPFKWAYCLSYSHSAGLKDFKTTLETYSGSEEVSMDLLPSRTINVSAQHHWKVGRKNRFNMEVGYAVPITENYYTIKDNSVLTDNSKLAMRIAQPGGVVLGVGFSLGL